MVDQLLLLTCRCISSNPYVFVATYLGALTCLDSFDGHLSPDASIFAYVSCIFANSLIISTNKYSCF